MCGRGVRSGASQLGCSTRSPKGVWTTGLGSTPLTLLWNTGSPARGLRLDTHSRGTGLWDARGRGLGDEFASRMLVGGPPVADQLLLRLREPAKCVHRLPLKSHDRWSNGDPSDVTLGKGGHCPFFMRLAHCGVVLGSLVHYAKPVRSGGRTRSKPGNGADNEMEA